MGHLASDTKQANVFLLNTEKRNGDNITWTKLDACFVFLSISEVTLLADPVVVRCYLRTKTTNVSSTRHQEIGQVILCQIILCSAYLLAMSLCVCISPLAPQL